MNVVAPALLAAWYFTQADFWLTALSAVLALGIFLSAVGLLTLILVVPRMSDAMFVDTLIKMKEGLETPVKYFSYGSIFGVLVATYYFGHFDLFIMTLAIMIMSLATRGLAKGLVESALKGATLKV